MTLLEARGLSKRFGGVAAVDGCSFAVPEGTITALVGPNGSGKTTVFNLLTGYLRADAGSVAFAGRPVRRPDPTRLARAGLTRTFQQARIFPELTLVENLVVAIQQPWHAIARRAVRHADAARALALLEEFGLAGHARERAATLSYGQKKLLEFAAVLMGEPKLVLLDEPTAGMNPQETGEFIDFIFRLREEEKLTVLLIEHDMRLVMGVSDRVTVLDYGEKIAEGTPQEIQKNERVIEAYLGTAAIT